MVNLLLAKGANINAFDKKDRRALHWAAYMGKAQLLVCSLFEFPVDKLTAYFMADKTQTCPWKMRVVFMLCRERVV